MSKEVYCALWRGDEFIAHGTYKEISKQTGLSRGYLQVLSCKSKKSNYTLIKLEDSEKGENMEMLEKIIRTAMEDQNTTCTPKMCLINQKDKRLIEINGGMRKLCGELGIKGNVVYRKGSNGQISAEEVAIEKKKYMKKHRSKIRDIIFNLMDEQNIKHVPNISMVENEIRNIINMAGGVGAIKKEFNLCSRLELERIEYKGRVKMDTVKKKMKSIENDRKIKREIELRKRIS